MVGLGCGDEMEKAASDVGRHLSAVTVGRVKGGPTGLGPCPIPASVLLGTPGLLNSLPPTIGIVFACPTPSLAREPVVRVADSLWDRGWVRDAASELFS